MIWNKQVLLIGIVSVLLIAFVTAAPTFIFEQTKQVDLKISCFDENNTLCTPDTPCQITINYPNQTNLVKNQSMSFNDNYHNYTLSAQQTATTGEYFTTITCQGNVSDGFTTFTYEINPTGIRSTDQRSEAITRSIWFVFGIAVMFFLAFLFFSEQMPVKWTFLILSIIFFVVGMNVVFVSLEDEVINPQLEGLFSFLTVSSLIFYYFAFFMILLIWFLTFFNTWFYKKNLRRFQKFE